MVTSRRSLRPAQSASDTFWDTLSTWFMIFSPNSTGRSKPRTIDMMSTPGSLICPRISTTLPSGLFVFVPYPVISTTTLCPVMAPFDHSFGTKISCAIFVLSGMTKPKLLLDCSYVPTTWVIPLAMIRMTCASCRLPVFAGRSATSTVSLWNAPPCLSSGMNRSSSLPSTSTNPKPLALLIKVPVRTLPLDFIYLPLTVRVSFPSAKSSRKISRNSSRSSFAT